LLNASEAVLPFRRRQAKEKRSEIECWGVAEARNQAHLIGTEWRPKDWFSATPLMLKADAIINATLFAVTEMRLTRD